MTETLNKIVVDCSTGEQTIVSLTAAEIAQREKDQMAYEAQQATQKAEEVAKAAARASLEAKLSALGITVEELATL